jgi:hypothetical protein
MTRATRPVLDIRGLVVHGNGTLILDRLGWRVQSRSDLLRAGYQSGAWPRLP